MCDRSIASSKPNSPGCTSQYFLLDGVWNVMAHANKPDFVFRRNGWVHLNQLGRQVQSTTGSRGVRISGSNAGYTMFRGSVKSTGYPLHSPVYPSFPLPCVTVCHHISIGLYQLQHLFSLRSSSTCLRLLLLRLLVPSIVFLPPTVGFSKGLYKQNRSRENVEFFFFLRETNEHDTWKMWYKTGFHFKHWGFRNLLQIRGGQLDELREKFFRILDG
jgi:hypothetical protein